MDLFNSSEIPPPKPTSLAHTSPLSSRMRPQNLNEIRGQDHLLGTGCLLSELLMRIALTVLFFMDRLDAEKLLWQK